MPLYVYKAVSQTGEIIEGELDAPNQKAVVELLHTQGHVPIRADEVGSQARRAARAGLRRGHRISERTLAELTRQLAVLLTAGLELDRALTVLIDVVEEPRLEGLLRRVQGRVQGGGSLSEALAAEGDVFSRLYVNMVRAGETAGALDVVLRRLAEYMERSLALKESVKSALIYPTILVAVAGLSIVVLIMFVLPRFAVLFEDMGATVPWPTQVVMAVGAFARQWGWLVLAVAAGLVLAARRLLASPQMRRRWDAWVLDMPLLGLLVARIEVARFSRTLGTLLGNGVPMLTALAGVKETFGNSVMAAAMDRVEENLKQGRGLAQPLAETGVFPRQAVHMIRVGEETGKLEEMLERVADAYDREVRTALTRLLALLEPALILALGVIVAGIVLSLLMAILSINDLPI
ncbi:MAG: type II secretion system F family protein [Chromatiales bacterium]